jgi:hypothetical protein
VDWPRRTESRDMPSRRNLTPEDKLDALRKGDPVHQWRSLDDRRCCILCDRTFSGRQVDVSVSATGRVRLRCPSDACESTPREWVHPGNPLVSRKAWQDWSRVLAGSSNSTARAPRAARSTNRSNN